jgi:IS4 transposase
MDVIPYEQGAYYVFGRGYYDLERLYHMQKTEAYFVIRQRGNIRYDVTKVNGTNHNENGVLMDQVMELTGYQTRKKYIEPLRRITYYAKDKNKTFVYLTNNMEMPAVQVALLYKYRWHVELFFK